MATYLELKARAEKLLIEAEELRGKEIKEVVSEIKEKMALYGLTTKDLGLGGAKTLKSPPANRAGVRYRGPEGQTWSGGRGRKPRWVTEALQQGKKLEDFEIKA